MSTAGESCSWVKFTRPRTCSGSKARMDLTLSLGFGSSPTAEATTTPPTARASVKLEIDTDQDCAAGLTSNTAVAVLPGNVMTPPGTGTGARVTAVTSFEGASAEAPSKGVRQRGTKWVAEIRNRHIRGGKHPGRKWLGTFDTASEAKEAYAKAIKKIKLPSLRGPGRPRSSNVPIHEAPNTRLELSAAAPSSSSRVAAGTSTGAKRGPDSLPALGHIRSKKARTRVAPSDGSVANLKLKFVASYRRAEDAGQEGANGRTSFEQGGGKAGAVPMTEPATRSPGLIPKDDTGSNKNPFDLWFTNVNSSLHSSCSTKSSAAVSPSVFSLKSWGTKKFEKHAPCEVSNDAPPVSTIFSCSSPMLDDIIDCFPAVHVKVRYNCPASSANQIHPSPVCTSFLFFTEDQTYFPAAVSCVCNCGWKLYGEEEDLAAFKTRHLLSEMSRLESRCEGFSPPQPDRRAQCDGGDYGKPRSSPMFEFSLPASFSVCSCFDCPAHQVYFMEPLSVAQFEHLYKPELSLMEFAFLTFDFLGLRDIGSDFSPVDDLLRYF